MKTRRNRRNRRNTKKFRGGSKQEQQEQQEQWWKKRPPAAVSEVELTGAVDEKRPGMHIRPYDDETDISANQKVTETEKKPTNWGKRWKSFSDGVGKRSKALGTIMQSRRKKGKPETEDRQGNASEVPLDQQIGDDQGNAS